MRIKKGFELRDVCGEKVVVATGLENADFSKLIALNESAAYLWQAVADAEFDAQRLASLLCEAYEIDEATALRDAGDLLDTWTANGLVE